MATYCTSTQVAEVLQISNFNAGSTPKDEVIDRYIERAEAKIESITAHAWQTKTISNEYLEPSSLYRYGTGIRFKLTHRSIKTFSTGSGDKLEVWDGNSWVDYVSAKTEGRGNDFWVNYEEGVVYLIGINNIYPDGVRCTYRYGESTVSASIEECACLMAAIMVLNSPEFVSATFTDDGGSSRRNDDPRISEWKETINNILANNTEFNVF